MRSYSEDHLKCVSGPDVLVNGKSKMMRGSSLLEFDILDTRPPKT